MQVNTLSSIKSQLGITITKVEKKELIALVFKEFLLRWEKTLHTKTGKWGGSMNRQFTDEEIKAAYK